MVCCYKHIGISTSLEGTDIFTKAMTRHQHEFLDGKLLLVDNQHPYEEGVNQINVIIQVVRGIIFITCFLGCHKYYLQLYYNV